MPIKKHKATDSNYLEFVEWEAKPHHLMSDDEPKSYDEIAKKLGVVRKTLYDWRKIEGHWDRVTKSYNKYHKSKLLDVRDALYNRANGVTVETRDKKGELIYKELPPDPKAIELYLKYEDKWREKMDTEISGTITINADEAVKEVLKAKEALNAIASVKK